ncbi:hypothetical protein [Streptomyces sp. 8N706]
MHLHRGLDSHETPLSLSVDAAEHATLARLVAQCPGTTVNIAPAP